MNMQGMEFVKYKQVIIIKMPMKFEDSGIVLRTENVQMVIQASLRSKYMMTVSDPMMNITVICHDSLFVIHFILKL